MPSVSRNSVPQLLDSVGGRSCAKRDVFGSFTYLALSSYLRLLTFTYFYLLLLTFTYLLTYLLTDDEGRPRFLRVAAQRDAVAPRLESRYVR